MKCTICLFWKTREIFGNNNLRALRQNHVGHLKKQNHQQKLVFSDIENVKLMSLAVTLLFLMIFQGFQTLLYSRG